MEKEITIKVRVDQDCTEEQFTEWIEYSVGYRGGCSIDNPLHDLPLQATDVTVY